MIHVDVDFEEIEEISNLSAKKIAHQLRLNGFATTKDNRISLKISQKIPEFRNKKYPKILMGFDTRTREKMIAINPALMNPDKELKKFIKEMIKKF